MAQTSQTRLTRYFRLRGNEGPLDGHSPRCPSSGRANASRWGPSTGRPGASRSRDRSLRTSRRTGRGKWRCCRELQRWDPPALSFPGGAFVRRLRQAPRSLRWLPSSRVCPLSAPPPLTPAKLPPTPAHRPVNMTTPHCTHEPSFGAVRRLAQDHPSLGGFRWVF